MKKIAITGSHGVVGTVLKKRLSEYSITPLDLPKVDVRNYSKLLKIFPGHDVIIHLAWKSTTDNFISDTIDIDNTKMFLHVYKVAVASGVKRVIMASSIHAKDNTPYAAHKRLMEDLGKYYSKKYNLDVFCIRFGGINAQNSPSIPEKDYKKIWLSHNDCVALVRSCIDTPIVPGRFQIITGISKK